MNNDWVKVYSTTDIFKAEIIKQMTKMKDSAPGADQIRLKYILAGGELLKGEIVRLIQFMFENDASKWEKTLKLGHVIPLYKKGNRNDSL